MTKKEFLDELRRELEAYSVNDIDSIIEYYDELIEDRKEAQKKKKSEKEIVESLGSISEITKNVIIDQKLEIASKKPTISNGFKALIAVLGVMSLPILIPVAIVIGALLFTGIVLLASFVIVVAALVIAFFATAIALFGGLIVGELPFATFIFTLGVSLIFLGLSTLLLKWLSTLTKQSVSWFVDLMKSKMDKRKGVDRNE